MDADKKAIELVEKYKGLVYPYLGSSMLTNDEHPSAILSNAKTCATILVDSLLSEVDWYALPGDKQTYWEEVKAEIEKLE